MIRRAKIKPKRYEGEMRVSQAKCLSCGHEWLTGRKSIKIKCPKCGKSAKRIIQGELK